MTHPKMLLAQIEVRPYHETMARVSEDIRKAIRNCGMTRYEIAKRTGVSQGTLSRFMHGKNALTLDSVDKLAGTLGLELIVRGKRGKKR